MDSGPDGKFWIDSTVSNKSFFYGVKNGLTYDLISQLDHFVESEHLLHTGTLVGGVDQSHNRVTEVAWIDTDTNKEVYDRLSDLVHFVNTNYFKFNISYLETLQYSVYPIGGHYVCHTDGFLKGWNGFARKISFSLGLNDPSEYEGGELEIWTGGANFKTTLNKGEALFFPSWIPHQVHPVTNGTRKSLVGWVHGPDFI
jgi:PKHD-type hydroxylase|tara:strand:+ start:239 stop:835 length:597 start_codon:yes stop_codon:yes gene_type:complete